MTKKKKKNAVRTTPAVAKYVVEGFITESLRNGMFRVSLDNDNKDLILGYISGRIRKNHIRIIPGDRVKIEISNFDLKGRITHRFD